MRAGSAARLRRSAAWLSWPSACTQDAGEHPLVAAGCEVGCLAERQQEAAGMPGGPLLAALPAGEEVHEVAEALDHAGVEGPVGHQERHDRFRVSRLGDAGRGDGEMDQLAGDW